MNVWANPVGPQLARLAPGWAGALPLLAGLAQRWPQPGSAAAVAAQGRP